MKYILLLLFLGGCATPIDDLRRVADECGLEESCEPLLGRWEKRLIFRDEQLRNRNSVGKDLDAWRRSRIH